MHSDEIAQSARQFAGEMIEVSQARRGQRWWQGTSRVTSAPQPMLAPTNPQRSARGRSSQTSARSQFRRYNLDAESLGRTNHPEPAERARQGWVDRWL